MKTPLLKKRGIKVNLGGLTGNMVIPGDEHIINVLSSYGKTKKGEIIGLRDQIITAVQKKADTKKQKIDASIVSRVASLTLDETIRTLSRKKD